MLARSPRYLMQSALLLVFWLDDVDPGGRWGNRPAVSLRRILLVGHHKLMLIHHKRIKVIDRSYRCIQLLVGSYCSH